MPRRITSFRPVAGVPAESRHREYDRTRRNAEAKAFYNSRPWVALRRIHLRSNPLCKACLAEGQYRPAKHVHHVVEVLEDPARRLDRTNLESLCHSHHSQVHRARARDDGGQGAPPPRGGQNLLEP